MNLELVIFVHEISDLPPGRKIALSELYFVGDLGNSASAQSTSLKSSMKWQVNDEVISSIKSSNPMVKVKVCSKSETLGYALLDIRDIQRKVVKKSFKVNGLPGVELTLSAGVNAPLSVAESRDDMSNIDLEQGLEISADRFTLAFSLEDFLDLKELCSRLTPNSSRLCWLSWTLFGRVFQSESFAGEGPGPRRSRDVIRVRGSRTSLLDSLRAEFPLKVFLCTEGDILGVCEVSFEVSPADELPLSLCSWFDVSPLEKSNALPSASIKVALTASAVVDEASPGVNPEDAPLEANEEDPYFEEAFEEEVPASLQEKAVQAAGKAFDASLRHFRVSVDVRSISGLRRSCHAFVQFAYPHLGSKAPVRSHPMWVPANSEVALENANVTYDTVLTLNAMQSVVEEHPLVINIKAKSHLGNEDIGFFEVDVAALLEQQPHSFRCPVTKKNFRNLDDFIAHRNAIALLNATGKTKLECPADPIEVRVSDSFYNILHRTEGKLRPSSDGGRVRVVLAIENLGVVGYEMGVPVKPGYKMQGGGLYEHPVENQEDLNRDIDEGATPEVEPAKGPVPQLDDARHLESLKSDWEIWRRAAEGKWREELREKEAMLRKSLEEENKAILSAKADDLRRAHEEAGRLEVRLRGAIDAVEKQRAQLILKEDQVNMKLAQKSSELQLLERRIREEARAKVEAETRRCEGLERQLENLKESLQKMERRAKDAERDFETYRQQVRGMPETQLREEVAKLRAQLAETRTEIERERRQGAERELEKEHFRAQMHRLALALKRERERSTAVARQELEQLRLEFLAREERYVLDGDREELRTIRNALSQLKSGAGNPAEFDRNPKSDVGEENSSIDRLKRKKEELLSTGLYDENEDPIIEEINRAIRVAESSIGRRS